MNKYFIKGLTFFIHPFLEINALNHPNIEFFNNTTNELNTACEQFPSVLVAKMFGFKQEAFFDVGDDEREKVETAPEVKF